MPNVASIAAPPAHASPAPKEKESASGKKDTVRPDFARVFREKASPIQSQSGSTAVSGTTNPVSQFDKGKTPEESSVVEIPAADPGDAVPQQLSPDLLISADVKQAVGAPHAGTPIHFPSEPSGKGKSASEIEIADIAPPAGAKTGKTEDAPSLPSADSTTLGKKKVPSRDSDGKTKAAAPLPNPEPMALTTFSPLLSVLPAAGGASVQSGDGAKSLPKQETSRGPQSSGGRVSPLRLSQYGLPEASSAADGTGDAEIGQVAPFDNGAEFDVPAANGDEIALNSANQSGSSAPPTYAAPVVHADPRKLMGETGATGTPPATFTGHISTELAVPGVQHVEGASLPASSAAGLAVNSPVASTPYDRIDQGAAPVVLHSGAQHVSVGVQDPDLGWVEIQTQGAAGHVAATLITASGQTHASLAAQLPAMAQYLEQRDVRVGALVVQHHPGTGGGGVGGGGSGYGSANNGAGAHHSNPENSGGDRTPPRYGGHASGNLPSVAAMNVGARPGEEGSALRAVSYISVRA